MIYDSWVFAKQTDAAIPIANPTLRSVFARRGVDSEEKFTRFVSPTLDDLIDGITDENRHNETAWGPPVGGEVW